jgi:hypothetical protein
MEKYYVSSWDCVFKKKTLGHGTNFTNESQTKPKSFMPMLPSTCQCYMKSYMIGQLVILCNMMVQKLLISY